MMKSYVTLTEIVLHLYLSVLCQILRKGHNYLFMIEAEKFSATHKRPFFLRLKKQTQTSTFVTIYLFPSMEEMIDSFL